MAITLSQLCANTEKKYSMKLIAGHAGMGNTVRWVHILKIVRYLIFCMVMS